jgi:hypothetical protein
VRLWKKTTNKTGMTKTATIRKTTETRKTIGTTIRKTGIIGANIDNLACRIKVVRNKEWPGIMHFNSKPFFIFKLTFTSIIFNDKCIQCIINWIRGGLLW